MITGEKVARFKCLDIERPRALLHQYHQVWERQYFQFRCTKGRRFKFYHDVYDDDMGQEQINRKAMCKLTNNFLDLFEYLLIFNKGTICGDPTEGAKMSRQQHRWTKYGPDTKMHWRFYPNPDRHRIGPSPFAVTAKDFSVSLAVQLKDGITYDLGKGVEWELNEPVENIKRVCAHMDSSTVNSGYIVSV